MQGDDDIDFRTYRVVAGKRAGTLDWLIRGLEAGGCRIITPPRTDRAPFKVVFQSPDGERIGTVFYLFTITCVETKNRPSDECRFQIKYADRDGLLHGIWQDPTGLYTTVLLGIDPITGCWVAADPVLHNPTLMYISLEFKQNQFDLAQASGWHAWERESKIRKLEPVEVLVGGRPERLLDLVRFERAAKGLDQGHRELLATTHLADALRTAAPLVAASVSPHPTVEPVKLHRIAAEFEMDPDEILTLIADSPRLKMAVRGWVAEEHLRRVLETLPGVTECERLNVEGEPDVRLFFQGHGPLYVECKNVLRQRTADGLPRVDFQRTRASKGDPCSRYYRPEDFDVLAACLHAVTEQWEFLYRLPREMAWHRICPGRLSNLVRVDANWSRAEQALAAASGSMT
jgi:hypothetical protein